MNNKIKYWGIHNINEETILLSENVIAIGWKELGDLNKLPSQTREEYYKLYREKYPDAKEMSLKVCAGQVYRFVNEAKIGDIVIFPSKFDRKINIGRITGEYYYDSSDKEYPQKRKVEWLHHIERSNFSQGALYELGSILSFFNVKNYYDEFENIIENKVKRKQIEEDLFPSTDAIMESTKDYVLRELSKNYKGYELENVVASLLNAMGYNTKVSKHGGDRGKDIIAYKDELPPRIIVQVKSQDGDISETTVQSLKGAMKEGDYGLFVTLSNFTPNAKNFLENQPIIKSINGSELVDLILKYYDSMPEDFKDTIKLKRIFIPIVEEE